MISSAGVEVVVAKKKLQRKVVNKLTGEISSVIPKQHISSDDDPAMMMPVNQSLSSVFFRNLQKVEEGNNRVDKDKVIFFFFLLLLSFIHLSICDKSSVNHTYSIASYRYCKQSIHVCYDLTYYT
jgi:hypothetical protein